jgi:hypothetical protein
VIKVTKAVKVTWTEGDDEGAVVFTGDGPDTAEKRAASYITDNLQRQNVENVKTTAVTLDEEGRVKATPTKAKPEVKSSKSAGASKRSTAKR